MPKIWAKDERRIRPSCACPWPRRGKIAREMRLVRGLVGAEARVAIDPVDRLLRIVDVLRREGRQVGVDRLDQVDHRSFHLGIENLLARLEPFAACYCSPGRSRNFNASGGNQGTYYSEEMLSRLSAIPYVQISENVPLRAIRASRSAVRRVAGRRLDAEEALAALLEFARVAALPSTLIGGGTNLMVADEGFPGVVVRYTAEAHRNRRHNVSASKPAPSCRTWWISASSRACAAWKP